MAVPFGLHFAETPSHQSSTELTKPLYDQQTGISFVIDDMGERHPFVLWAWSSAGDTGTGTATKIAKDKEDTDDDVRRPVTRTTSETREDTDVDYA